jgi:hypothetical protein
VSRAAAKINPAATSWAKIDQRPGCARAETTFARRKGQFRMKIARVEGNFHPTLRWEGKVR